MTKEKLLKQFTRHFCIFWATSLIFFFSPVEGSWAQTVTKFSLYDEDKNKSISGYGNLKNGQTIDLNKISAKNVNIKAQISGTVRSVRFSFQGRSRVESVSPFTLLKEGDGGLQDLGSGSLRFSAQPFQHTKAKGKSGKSVSLRLNIKRRGSQERGAPAVLRFSLYDSDKNQTIKGYEKLEYGQTIDLDKIKAPRVNIKAHVESDSTQSVSFDISGQGRRSESVAPYTVLSEKEGGLKGFDQGTFRFTATPFSAKGTEGRSGRSVQFSVYLKQKVSAGPRPGAKKNVYHTIIIDQPGTYDFRGVQHIWRGGGSCNQKENQPPILLVASSNVTVKNFYWQGAPDGVHVHCTREHGGSGQGNKCRKAVENVNLVNFRGHACEDLLTTGAKTKNISIIGGEFRPNPNSKYRDKTMQLNFANNMKIIGAKFIGGERCVRTKAGARLEIRDSVFTGCRFPIMGDTGKDIAGVPSGKSARIYSRNNTYKDCSRAFSERDSKIRISSSGDEFRNCKKE